MVRQQLHVFVRKLLAVELLDAVGQQATVQPDEVLFGQFADERRDVFVLDVGIRIVFRAGRRIRGVAVVDQKIEFFAVFAVFGVLLPVEHVAFRYGEVVFGHKRHLDLVLNLLDAHAVRDADAAQHGHQIVVCGVGADRKKRLADGVFDFVDRERLAFPVALDDAHFRDAHSLSVFCFSSFSGGEDSSPAACVRLRGNILYDERYFSSLIIIVSAGSFVPEECDRCRTRQVFWLAPVARLPVRQGDSGQECATRDGVYSYGNSP